MTTLLGEQLKLEGSSALLDGASDPALSMCLAGLSVVQTTRPPFDYQSRWYRAWEQELLIRARRVTGRECWRLSRFGVEDADAAKNGYRETLAAVAQAAKLAMSDAEKRCGRRGARERMALLYSDFWNRCSHLEQAFNWRDAFDLDVIPKFLLRDHAIDGFSCKLQAGRGAMAQGLQLANDLLHGGDIDAVLLGGVFRFYPALGFSEAIENATLERRWLGRGGRHTAAVVERAGFMVLRRGETVASIRSSTLRLDAPRYLALPAQPAAAGRALSAAWSELCGSQGALVLGGHYPSSLLESLETSSSALLGGQARYENVTRSFGDSGGVNPLLALQRLASINDNAQAGLGLLSLSDSSGGTWLVRCRSAHPGGRQ